MIVTTTPTAVLLVVPKQTTNAAASRGDYRCTKAGRGTGGEKKERAEYTAIQKAVARALLPIPAAAEVLQVSFTLRFQLPCVRTGRVSLVENPLQGRKRTNVGVL